MVVSPWGRGVGGWRGGAGGVSLINSLLSLLDNLSLDS